MAVILTSNKRATGSGKYGIELDGVNAGWISEVEGGHATADVVTEKMGTDHLQRKHLGPLKYEEVSFKCGTGMTKDMYKWIQSGFNQTHMSAGRRNGAIVHSDYDFSEISRLEWKFGLLTEWGMPALDASSKDPCKMSIKFKPEITRKITSSGGKVNVSKNDAKVQKQWLPSNFRLRIDALDDGCMKINKIEAITVKQKVAENAVGEMRDYEQEPTSVEIPNLVITLAESHAVGFYKWHEDFVIKGLCKPENEKGATLEYLHNDLTTVLFTLHFVNLGIFKISPDKVEAGSEGIRRVKVEMYCEDITFDYNSAITFA